MHIFHNIPNYTITPTLLLHYTGSVVVMSARLMGKAYGSILIDDATQARLPANISKLLTTLDPMVVKGRDEPLPVFQYTVFEPIVPLKETLTIEDEEVKSEYKAILNEVLSKITTSSCSSTQGSNNLNYNNTTTVHQQQHNNTTTTTPTLLPIVLLEGTENMGRTAVVTWLRKQTTRLQIPSFSVKLTRKDGLISYSLWNKLFQQLMPRDLFHDKSIQRRHIRTLLKEIYPNEGILAETLGFPVMQLALGVTCTYAYHEEEHPHTNNTITTTTTGNYIRHPTTTANTASNTTTSTNNNTTSTWHTQTVLGALTRIFHPTVFTSTDNNNITHTSHIVPPLSLFSTRPKPSAASMMKIKLTPKLILETLKRIFTHLLSWQTVVIIFENIHCADIESLQLLQELLLQPTSSLIIVTAAIDAEQEWSNAPFRRIRTSDSLSVSSRRVTSKSYPWKNGSIRRRIIERMDSTHILLEDYTLIEMNQMLAVALDVPINKVPIEFSQLVLDFSGGSFYWMKEILQFIREHGPGEFLSTIDEVDVTLQNSNEGSNSAEDNIQKLTEYGLKHHNSRLSRGMSIAATTSGGTGIGNTTTNPLRTATTVTCSSAQPSPASTSLQSRMSRRRLLPHNAKSGLSRRHTGQSQHFSPPNTPLDRTQSRISGGLRLIPSAHSLASALSGLGSQLSLLTPSTPGQQGTVSSIPSVHTTNMMHRGLSRRTAGRSCILRSSPRGNNSNTLSTTPNIYNSNNNINYSSNNSNSNTIRQCGSNKYSIRIATTTALPRYGMRNSKHKFKLERLVVCRFEKLNAKMQHIFRTASIIGISFSIRILYGILPRQLKSDMTECIRSLLAQKWLFQDLDDEYLYHFAHSYLHGIIYELTPSGERNSVHNEIAEYIEETFSLDPTQYILLTHHYQYSNKIKSLHYCILSIEYILIQEYINIIKYEDIIDLLSTGLSCCKNIYDYEVLYIITNRVIIHIKNKLELYIQNTMKKPTKIAYSWRFLKVICAPVLGNKSIYNAIYPDTAEANIDTIYEITSDQNHSNNNQNSYNNGSSSNNHYNSIENPSGSLGLLLEDSLNIGKKIERQQKLLSLIVIKPKPSEHQTGLFNNNSSNNSSSNKVVVAPITAYINKDDTQQLQQQQVEPLQWQRDYIASAPKKGAGRLKKLINRTLHTTPE